MTVFYGKIHVSLLIVSHIVHIVFLAIHIVTVITLLLFAAQSSAVRISHAVHGGIILLHGVLILVLRVATIISGKTIHSLLHLLCQRIVGNSLLDLLQLCLILLVVPGRHLLLGTFRTHLL